MNMPLRKWMEHVQAKCEQVERELRKNPDFQLYLITRSRKDRARMERVLMGIPTFRLWRMLRASLQRAKKPARAGENQPALANQATSAVLSPTVLSSRFG